MVVVLVCGSLTYYVIRHVQFQLSVTVCNCIECDYTIVATVYCCESPSVSLATSDCSRSLPSPCLFLLIKTHNFLSLFRLIKISLPTLCLGFVSCSFHFLYLPNSLSVHQVSTHITIIVRKVRIQVHKRIRIHENTDTGPNARVRLCRVICAGLPWLRAKESPRVYQGHPPKHTHNKFRFSINTLFARPSTQHTQDRRFTS